jgi:predicted nucleotidyltransferase
LIWLSNFFRSSRLGPAHQYFRFKQAFERHLGRPIELVEVPAMPDSRLRRSILREQVALYGQAA